LAQTRCVFGHKLMANIWMHNGFLQVEGQKMSKSLGNFVTINELLNTNRFGGRRWPGDVVRLAMLKSNYRQPIDWTIKILDEAYTNLRSLQSVKEFSENEGTDSFSESAGSKFLDAMSEDLNTSAAFSTLLDASSKISIKALTKNLDLLGIDLDRFTKVDWEIQLPSLQNLAIIESLVDDRETARKAKNWAESDRIRDELSRMGIAIKDNKDGTTSWEVKR
jgi:cysteinyl-tRNA synthetase